MNVREYAGCLARVCLFSLVVVLMGVLPSFGHPGSGIVVDAEGRIYFTDTGQGVWRIDERGKVTAMKGSAFHWMTIDRESRFAGEWPEFVEPSTKIERVGRHPTLLVASDFPITTDGDGALYYPEFAEKGPLRVYKLDRSGKRGARSVLATLPTGADGGELKWLNGMAAGPDGSIYFSENAAVRRITRDGVVKTIARNVTVPDCQWVGGAEDHLGPMLRGLDIDRAGNVYVAASGCRALLKISPQGVVRAILRTEAPWSPTGVAVSGEVIYVLEYLHTNGGNRREWLPRVRKISADGSSSIIVGIERVGEKESRPVTEAEAGVTQ